MIPLPAGPYNTICEYHSGVSLGVRVPQKSGNPGNPRSKKYILHPVKKIYTLLKLVRILVDSGKKIKK